MSWRVARQPRLAGLVGERFGRQPRLAGLLSGQVGRLPRFARLFVSPALLGCSVRICSVGVLVRGLSLGGILDLHAKLLGRWVIWFVGLLWVPYS
jgi:hypothetical protein